MSARDIDLDAMLTANLHGGNGTAPMDPTEPWWVNWDAEFAHDRGDTEWYVDSFWPVGRQVHVHATRKAGKSLLMLYVAACLAIGRDPFTGKAIPPRIIGYLDYEMVMDDVLERLLDMGFAPQDLGNLKYRIMPDLPPLDTHKGGEALLERLVDTKCEALIYDTLSRAVEGDENSNDTYRRLYLHTGMLLKANGIGVLRSDHSGHEESRSRGASAKMDDPDIVWHLKAKDKAVELERTYSRLRDVPERINLAMSDDPLSYRRVGMPGWTTEALHKATEMDSLGMPWNISVRKAQTEFKALGLEVGRNAALAEAVRYRKWAWQPK